MINKPSPSFLFTTIYFGFPRHRLSQRPAIQTRSCYLPFPLSLPPFSLSLSPFSLSLFSLSLFSLTILSLSLSLSLSLTLSLSICVIILDRIHQAAIPSVLRLFRNGIHMIGNRVVARLMVSVICVVAGCTVIANLSVCMHTFLAFQPFPHPSLPSPNPEPSRLCPTLHLSSLEPPTNRRYALEEQLTTLCKVLANPTPEYVPN